MLDCLPLLFQAVRLTVLLVSSSPPSSLIHHIFLNSSTFALILLPVDCSVVKPTSCGVGATISTIFGCLHCLLKLFLFDLYILSPFRLPSTPWIDSTAISSCLPWLNCVVSNFVSLWDWNWQVSVIFSLEVLG